MRKPDAYPEIVDAPDQRSSTFEASWPNRARHRAHVGSEQWRRAWILRRARLAGLTWPLPEGMDDEGFELLLFPALTAASQSDRRPAPDWAYVEKELRRRSVTRLLLWEEYRAANPDGFGYTWFCTTFEAWRQRARPSMRQTHIGGEKVFVDFASDTIDIFDPITGEVRAMKLSVAALGASNYTYAEACPSDRLSDWIGVHGNLFRYLGGVPNFVVCDNLKAAATSPDRYDPGINRTDAEMVGHYGTAILAARPRRPKDKAKVEVAVQIAQRWILARLRNHHFFSQAELNAAIGVLVATSGCDIGPRGRRERHSPPRHPRPSRR